MTTAAGTSPSVGPSRFATVSLPLDVMPVILPRSVEARNDAKRHGIATVTRTVRMVEVAPSQHGSSSAAVATIQMLVG